MNGRFIECIDLTKFMPQTLADDAMQNIEEALKDKRMEANQNIGRMEGTQNARKISRADLRQWLVSMLNFTIHICFRSSIVNF